MRKRNKPYSHGLLKGSTEYTRMKYLCKVYGISYEEYCTNTDRYPLKGRRTKHLSYSRGTPEYVRSKNLSTLYGIELSEYNILLKKQGGKCAICKEESDTLVVDHCHSTNHIRGLLCSRCNIGLGNFRDNTNFMEEAIEYIKTNRECKS